MLVWSILFRVGPYFGLLFLACARADPKNLAHIPSTTILLMTQVQYTTIQH
jgi:hypothetical protein